VNVATHPSRTPWWSGALAGVVLALAIGILGMHVLTTGHGTHPATDGPRAAATSHHGDADSHLVAAHLLVTAPEQVRPPVAASALGAPCDDDCAAGVGSVCVAVLVGVLLLLRRTWMTARGAPPEMVRLRDVPGALRHIRPAPNLALLCVSRT